MQGHTTLVIARRLAMIQKADRIIVLDESKLVESGTHEAQVAQEGVYVKLVALQFGAVAA